MKLKIFQANGAAEIAQLEGEINNWLAAGFPAGTVSHTDVALCTVSDGGEAERYQSAIITVWYD